MDHEGTRHGVLAAHVFEEVHHTFCPLPQAAVAHLRLDLRMVQGEQLGQLVLQLPGLQVMVVASLQVADVPVVFQARDARLQIRLRHGLPSRGVTGSRG
jgi:hypothetical protein